MSSGELIAAKKEWDRWLIADHHNALWPRIRTMLHDDLEFRILLHAATSHKNCVLNSPILWRNLVRGYAANQGLAIRCLVCEDKRAFSLSGLLSDIKCKMPFEAKRAGVINSWLNKEEIEKVVNWSHVFLAHAGDSENGKNTKKGDFSKLAPNLDILKSAHRLIVRAAVAISVYVLGYPMCLDVVPIYGGYDPFSDLAEITGDYLAPSEARQLWLKLRNERNEWVSGIAEELAKAGS
jgi:hypothetical protein